MRAWSIARLGVEHDLRGAQERVEMELHYQPKLSLESDEIIGMEALIRWNHPERGRVAPDSFIAVAEETGRFRATSSSR